MVNKTDNKKQEEQILEILNQIKTINKRLTNIEEQFVDNKKAKNKVYVLIEDWKNHIQKDCEHKLNVSVEGEAEYFCKITNNICNIINCPLNIKE